MSQNNFIDHHSTSESTSTDYESAQSHVESESEAERFSNAENEDSHNNTEINDTVSVETVQQIKPIEYEEQIQSTSQANFEHEKHLVEHSQLQQEAGENDENQPISEYSLDIKSQDSDDQADGEQPFQPQSSQELKLTRTKTLERTHKSFNDANGIYGPPTSTKDPVYPELEPSEDFHLALTRTISRKSVTKEQLIKEAKKSLAAEERKTPHSKEEEQEVSLQSLDWDSPTDSDNPKNWSTWRKWVYTMITALICLTVSFGSSLYVCGIEDIMVEMHVSEELAISGLTFYMIGLSLGPIIGAPLSELFGRRIVYITSLPISMLLTMGVGLSNKIRDVLVLRFFAGFFSSPAMAIAGGTIADLWDFEMMGIAMAGFCLAPFMGPVLGPIIGGFVAEKKGWKWTMWVNLMMAGLILLPVLLTPETYKPIILKKRAEKRGVKLAKPEISIGQFLKTIVSVTIMTPLKMLVVEPIVMVFSIYIAFIFAVLFGFFEAYPIIFRGVYGMSDGISGLTFLGICIGFIIAVILYLWIDVYIFFPKNPDGTRGARDANGKLIPAAPETRLILCKIGALALPPALFWLGWTSKRSVHWISAVIAGVPFGFGLLLIFFSTIIYFSMTYPPLSLASALAANNLFRYILASVFPLFVVQMYKKLKIGWASSVFGFIALALVPVPWIFEKWGPALRARSTYGYAAMFKKAAEESARLQKLQEEAEEAVLNEGSSEDLMDEKNA